MKQIIGLVLCTLYILCAALESSAFTKVGAGLGECYGGFGVKIARAFHVSHSAQSSTAEVYIGVGTISGKVALPVLGIKGHFDSDHGIYGALSFGGVGEEKREVFYQGTVYKEENQPVLGINVIGGYDVPLNHKHSILLNTGLGGSVYWYTSLKDTPVEKSYSGIFLNFNLGVDFVL